MHGLAVLCCVMGLLCQQVCDQVAGSYLCVCVCVCVLEEAVVMQRGRLPGLCPAWGKAVSQRDKGTHFLNSGSIVASDFLWNPSSGSSPGSSPFAPVAPLGKALSLEELLGWGERKSL